MFSKVQTGSDELTPTATEALADLLFEMGKDLHRKSDSYRSSKWLDRAHQVLLIHDIESLSPDATELRLSIIYLLG